MTLLGMIAEMNEKIVNTPQIMPYGGLTNTASLCLGTLPSTSALGLEAKEQKMSGLMS